MMQAGTLRDVRATVHRIYLEAVHVSLCLASVRHFYKVQIVLN